MPNARKKKAAKNEDFKVRYRYNELAILKEEIEPYASMLENSTQSRQEESRCLQLHRHFIQVEDH